MRYLKAFPLAILLFSTILISQVAQAATDWMPPNPEELSMKAEPAAPGAVAIALYREEITDDNRFSISVYERIKILTEQGKEYGDIKIPYERRDAEISDFSGRTIHSDGTVIPYQQKGIDQSVIKSESISVNEKSYAMPDVQVGSIVEYRYMVVYQDHLVVAPSWYVQSNLYTRKAHYKFIPYSSNGGGIIDSRGNRLDTIAFTSMLPAGVAPQKVREHASAAQYVPGSGNDMSTDWILDMTDIPAIPKVAHLPPIHGLSYRVHFFYTASRSADEFWNKEGKFWSKDINKFANPGPKVKAAVATLTSPADTQEQALRKIYAAVMQLQNTRYLHVGDVTAAEQKAPAKSSDDIWTRKRGNAKQITELFVAMARAAGMKAYVMAVTNRDHNIFARDNLNLSQLDDEIAIVQVNGTEQTFDPGALYCPYGKLDWTHTMTGGLRQTDSGTALGMTPGMSYKDGQSQRTASLWLANDGSVSGTVQMVYRGQKALNLRQQEADKDLTGVTKDFEEELKAMLPRGSTVQMINLASLKDGEQPLVVDYRIHAQLGTAQSSHLLVPTQLFEVNHPQVFVETTRKYPVYFHYPFATVDQVEISLPELISVDSLPKDESADDPNVAMYRAKTVQAGKKITFQRVYALAGIYIDPKDYSKLHDFFSQVNTGDTNVAMFTRSAPLARQ